MCPAPDFITMVEPDNGFPSETGTEHLSEGAVRRHKKGSHG